MPATPDPPAPDARTGRGSDADLDLAGELVREAGRLARRMKADGLQTFHKTSVSDVVSEADHAAERLITDRLAGRRPDDGLIGEEGARRNGRRTWFVDPVDGTYNFLSGLPGWCSAVGLAAGEPDADEPAGPATSEGMQPLLGAVYQPDTEELWLGGAGRPTTLNGRPVPLLADRPLAEVCVATYVHPTRMEADRLQPVLAVLAGAATVRMLGSGSVELAAVAGGRLGLYLQANCLPWDWLPGAALVRAAGGVTGAVRHRGQRWFVAGNRRAVDESVAAILGC